MKRKIGSILITIYGCDFCNAHQAISTAEGEASGHAGTLSYTTSMG